jgi:pimeloyl-ACP methyl ester carboxylesterase
MPDQSIFMGFHTLVPQVDENLINQVENSIEITGGEPYFQNPGVDSSKRRININVLGENIDKTDRWEGGRNVWIISHGWNGRFNDFVYDSSGQDSSLAQQVKTAHPNDIVLAINWSEASSTNFPLTEEFSNQNDVAGITASLNILAGSWIGPVAEKVAEQLAAWGVSSNHVNLIGHSLGTQLNTEIAYQLKERGLGKVKSLTALDPASDYNDPGTPGSSLSSLKLILDRISPAIAPTVFNRYSRGYTYKRTSLDGQSVYATPPDYQDVAEFSRAFLGRTSIAGSVEYSSQANEAILMDFGAPFPAEHISVATAFGTLVDSRLPNLVRNILELDDYQNHNNFQQNAFVASDYLQRRNFGAYY